MKKIALASLFFISLAACNNDNANESKKEETTKESTAGKKDPVCEMEYETSWTDYVVQGTDTTWFCSSTCKDAFAGNPAKYSKQ